jgi:TonB-dependent SusC/RagA subfamily outer membrane receptor
MRKNKCKEFPDIVNIWKSATLFKLKLTTFALAIGIIQGFASGNDNQANRLNQKTKNATTQQVQNLDRIDNSNVVSPLPSEQQRIITGKVTDAKGDPLPGVSVLVKGTSIGTTTNNDGGFSLGNVPSKATLVFSFIGMRTQEISVGNQSVFNISLEDESIGLEEVVAVGYGSQSKRNISGSISSVNSQAITRSTSTTLSAALVGKVQGITVRATDARPGNGTNIQIRNLGNPLYVIDGIPYGGITGTTGFGFTQGSGSDVFNKLSLEDIESISILKDASAAIYGLRASNGVILVTTKKGKKNEDVKINVNTFYGVQNFTRYPKPANAGQFVHAMVESEQNYGRDPRLLY